VTASEISEGAVLERARAVRLVVFDFDGVFTDNTVEVSQDGIESVRCWRGDGLGLQRLRQAGVAARVLSTEVNPVVSIRCRKLGIECLQGLPEKRTALGNLWAQGLATPDSTAYVGNDINDSGCLAAVGFPIVVADAHEDVVALAALITSAPGGRGAVREVCDLIVDSLSVDPAAERRP